MLYPAAHPRESDKNIERKGKKNKLHHDVVSLPPLSVDVHYNEGYMLLYHLFEYPMKCYLLICACDINDV